jgi:hypothetical protein
VLSPDKGPDGAKAVEMMKSLRKITMTKPELNPETLK